MESRGVLQTGSFDAWRMFAETEAYHKVPNQLGQCIGIVAVRHPNRVFCARWRRLGDSGQRIVVHFSALDGDGRLSAAEAAEWRETVFVIMDADDGGTLTRKEYMTIHLGQGADPDQRGSRYEKMWTSSGLVRFL